MTEQLADGIDVSSEVKHHGGECMPSAMECDFLVNPRPQYPFLNSLIRAGRGVNILKDMLIHLSSLAHQLRSLWRDVEIFLPLSLFLPEYNSGELSLLMHISPSEFQNIAPA